MPAAAAITADLPSRQEPGVRGEHCNTATTLTRTLPTLVNSEYLKGEFLNIVEDPRKTVETVFYDPQL